VLRRVALSALVLAAAVACSDSTSPTSSSGTSSFTFTGAGGGSFSASGVPPTTQADFGTHDWAGGFLSTPDGGYEVASAHARGSGNYDIVDMFIHRTTVGTEVIDSTCSTSTCTTLVFGRNLTQADANQFDYFCVATAGSLTITEIADNRVKGTFSGSGSCIDQGFTETPFEIAGGSFDVPLVANLPQ
jgi:hypothetical protein